MAANSSSLSPPARWSWARRLSSSATDVTPSAASASDGRRRCLCRLSARIRTRSCGRRRGPDQLLAVGPAAHRCPETLDLGLVRIRGEPAVAICVRRAVHVAHQPLASLRDRQRVLADRAREVLVRADRHERHEVQAELALRVDVVQVDDVVAVGAGGRRCGPEVLRIVPESEDDDHQALTRGLPPRGGVARGPRRDRAGRR